MRYFAFLTLLAVADVVFSHVNEDMFICKRFDTEFEVDKPKRIKPKPGPNKSEAKPPKPTSLEKRLQKLEARIDQLEKANEMMQSFDQEATVPPASPLTERCHVYHRNRCYVFVDKMGTISLQEATKECSERHGELANIYDEEHMDKIEEYLRETMKNEMEYFIVGMTYKKRTDKVLLRHGSLAPYVKWYADIFPLQNPEKTKIHIQVNKMQDRESGMFNVSPDSVAMKALCEIPRRHMKNFLESVDRSRDKDFGEN